MSYDPNYWGTMCDLDDEHDNEALEAFAWWRVIELFAIAVIVLATVAYLTV